MPEHKFPIKAPASRAWQVISDFPGYSTWNPWYTAGILDTEFKEGHRVYFMIRMKPGGKVCKDEFFITTIVPGRSIVLFHKAFGFTVTQTISVIDGDKPDTCTLHLGHTMAGCLAGIGSAYYDPKAAKLYAQWAESFEVRCRKPD